MDQQEKTAEEARKQARIDTARNGLRRALVRLAKASRENHEQASACSTRGTAAGQTAPSGQCSENH